MFKSTLSIIREKVKAKIRQIERQNRFKRWILNSLLTSMMVCFVGIYANTEYKDLNEEIDETQIVEKESQIYQVTDKMDIVQPMIAYLSSIYILSLVSLNSYLLVNI